MPKKTILTLLLIETLFPQAAWAETDAAAQFQTLRGIVAMTDMAGAERQELVELLNFAEQQVNNPLARPLVVHRLLEAFALQFETLGLDFHFFAAVDVENVTLVSNGLEGNGHEGIKVRGTPSNGCSIRQSSISGFETPLSLNGPLNRYRCDLIENRFFRVSENGNGTSLVGNQRGIFLEGDGVHIENNVFGVGQQFASLELHGDDNLIQGNFFGQEPGTERVLPLAEGPFVAGDRNQVRQNVVVGATLGIGDRALEVMPPPSRRRLNFSLPRWRTFQTLFTGLALYRPGGDPAEIEIEVFSANGEKVGEARQNLAPGHRFSMTIDQLVPAAAGQAGGFVRVTSDRGIVGQQLFGTNTLSLLSAVPPTIIRTAN